MRILITLLLFLNFIIAQAQLPDKAIKIIPEISLKIGSQQPAVGGQFTLTAGMMFNDYLYVGIGGGYASDMGMGGSTFPLYADGRFYFHPKKSFLFTNKDNQNDFQIDVQLGMDINPDEVFKTGFLAGIGFAYRFDFLKIKDVKIPAFYFGCNIEYNHSSYYDEYRGFILKDGYLTQTMLLLKLAFDINAFHLGVPKG